MFCGDYMGGGGHICANYHLGFKSSLAYANKPGEYVGLVPPK